jgi:hypothetical protein
MFTHFSYNNRSRDVFLSIFCINVPVQYTGIPVTCTGTNTGIYFFVLTVFVINNWPIYRLEKQI